jgi:carbohydrate-selective porin OprB
MNTDDCFRHFLLNTTNDAQLTRFLNQSATNIRRTFPAGLMTDAGMVVANPAFGNNPVYARDFTTGAYHGTVIWSWQLAMMAKGLEMQLGRCEIESNFSIPSAPSDSPRLAGKMGTKMSQKKQVALPVPAFYTDDSVYYNVKNAYNVLWDSIEANSDQLSSEVWSWVYRGGKFEVTPLGVLPAPPGVGGQTGESNFFLNLPKALTNS